MTIRPKDTKTPLWIYFYFAAFALWIVCYSLYRWAKSCDGRPVGNVTIVGSSSRRRVYCYLCMQDDVPIESWTVSYITAR